MKMKMKLKTKTLLTTGLVFALFTVSFAHTAPAKENPCDDPFFSLAVSISPLMSLECMSYSKAEAVYQAVPDAIDVLDGLEPSDAFKSAKKNLEETIQAELSDEEAAETIIRAATERK